MKKISKKTVMKIITVSLAVILFFVWVFLAIIHIESVSNAGLYNENSDTKFIAHRGYSSLYYENTREAFTAAARESFFYGIETDVRLTKDGVFVCSHEENPFEDSSVKISESTYEEIKDLPLKKNVSYEIDESINYRICAFSEYLTICCGYRKTAVIEIKQKLNKAQAKQFTDEVFAKMNWNNVVVCSFDKRSVDYVYDLYPYLNIKLFSPVKILASTYAEMGYNVGISKKAISKNFVEKCHKKGVYVDVYTVNDEATLAKVLECGVDYVTTDKKFGD